MGSLSNYGYAEQYYTVIYESEGVKSETITESVFKKLLESKTEGARFFSFDYNCMHSLVEDFDIKEMELSDISDEKERKRREAFQIVDDFIRLFEDRSLNNIHYAFADLDEDGVEEFCVGQGDCHSDAVEIFKKVNDEWNYMGSFGETGGFCYDPVNNRLSGYFGNQGCFTLVVLRLNDNGFEKVASSLDFRNAQMEQFYYIDIDLGDVSRGFTMDSSYELDWDNPCTKEEYDRYQESIFGEETGEKGTRLIGYFHMEKLYY